MNEVQRLIEARGTRFLLTGSSARKLRRGGVNLLGGRARTKFLHPLTWKELGAEGATRNVPAFSRFLKIAALCNGTIVNFTNAANDARVARTAVYEYLEILKDTLVLHELPAWRKTRTQEPLASSKYSPGTPEFGEAFETFLLHELVSHRDYVSGEPLGYWRSTSGFEVDFVLGDHTAVEVNAKENVSPQDVKSLRALAEEKKLRRYLCVCLATRPRRVQNIEILPFQTFLERLWAGAFT
jgi:predicted AAA+ superfamily ATPase